MVAYVSDEIEKKGFIRFGIRHTETLPYKELKPLKIKGCRLPKTGKNKKQQCNG